MTRGRQANTAHVVTGKTAPAGHEPYQQAAPESVLADVLQRDGDDLSATEQIRQAQEWAGGTGHLLNLWSATTRQTLYPDIDEQIKARLSESEAWRYQREHSRQVLQHTLRDAQLAGHDIGGIIERITVGPMDGARSVSSVLHGRLLRLQLQAQGHSVTWAQRTPENAPGLAHDLAAGLDDRCRELGERALENPEPWLTRHLGPPPGPDASPVLREDYARRAGTAAAYREGRGITDPEQAVSFGPHPGPELEALRKDTFRALEIIDEHAEIRAMSRGEREAQVLEGDRAQATAPRDTSSQLCMTAQAQTDPEPDPSEPETPAPEATEPELADDGRAARLDELQARADDAARRIDAQRAELDTSSEHTARIEREAQVERQAGRQAETPYEMEIEL